MMGDPLELLLLLALWIVPLAVGYFVIRLAVRHGVMELTAGCLGMTRRPDGLILRRTRHELSSFPLRVPSNALDGFTDLDVRHLGGRGGCEPSDRL